MVVGEIRETFCIYSDSIGNELGTIQLGETGIVIRIASGENYVVPYEYITSVKSEGEMTLGKLKAFIVFHDVMGNKHELAF
ncbi:MAG: hypothetical protein V1909_02005, partial [Candidatus Micrarchaeota archaeon]